MNIVYMLDTDKHGSYFLADTFFKPIFIIYKVLFTYNSNPLTKKLWSTVVSTI